MDRFLCTLENKILIFKLLQKIPFLKIFNFFQENEMGNKNWFESYATYINLYG